MRAIPATNTVIDRLFFLMASFAHIMNLIHGQLENTRFVFTGRTEVRLGASEYT